MVVAMWEGVAPAWPLPVTVPSDITPTSAQPWEVPLGGSGITSFPVSYCIALLYQAAESS